MEEVFAPFYGHFLADVAGQISHDLIMGTFSRRAGAHKMTGEVIVYEPQENGSNYYLTLGSHGEYDAIRTRVDAYRQIDEEHGHYRSS